MAFRGMNFGALEIFDAFNNASIPGNDLGFY
jgi:hypothetical protein